MKIVFKARRGKPNTGKLSRLDEKKREASVPVVIDPFEPRMPQNRSLSQAWLYVNGW